MTQKELTHDDIVRWVAKVNKDFGKSNDKFTVAWVERLIKCGATVELYDDWYVVYIIMPDAWGDMQLNILSANCIGGRAFYQMQARIHAIAKATGAKFIVQGSELDDRYNSWLVRKGYRPLCFRKEV